MAAPSAYPLNLGSEDVVAPEKKGRTESGDGDKDVWGEEKDEVVYSDDDSIPDEVFDEYMKQVAESEGFDVDDFSEYPMFGAIQPFLFIEKAIPHAELAIKHFNEKENANFEFVRVLKSNTEIVCGVFFYITFEAKDAADGQTKTFQAKVLRKILKQGVEVKFCRLKPLPTKQVCQPLSQDKQHIYDEEVDKEKKVQAQRHALE